MQYPQQIMTYSASFLPTALPPLFLLYLATPCVSTSPAAPVAIALTTTPERGKTTDFESSFHDEPINYHHATDITSPFENTESNDHADSQLRKFQQKNRNIIKRTVAITNEPYFEKLQSTQDPFVRASPLSVAAVCNDGIAMVSLHFPLDGEEYEWEKLQSAFENCKSDESSEKDAFLRAFRDLPLMSRGPLRIESIYDHSTATDGEASTWTHPPPMALLTAGWRTDGMALADAARELIAEETMLYTLPHTVAAMAQNGSDDEYDYHGDYGANHELQGSAVHGLLQQEQENTQQHLETTSTKHEDQALSKINSSTSPIVPSSKVDGTQRKSPLQLPPIPVPANQYARRIAEGLSYYMAKCSFSEGTRSLSCVGLLACGASINNMNRRERGTLQLVDSTGIHPVRAHAIGNGAMVINGRLGFVDFGQMDSQNGLRVLLRLIAEEGGLIIDGKNNSEGKNGISRDPECDVKVGSNVVEECKNAEEVVIKGNFDMIEESSSDSELSVRSIPWNLPRNAAVELAILRTQYGRMKRIRLSSLLSESK
ncbi:hypothetical protein ACHAXS_009377 [Conticribra weissflogii]